MEPYIIHVQHFEDTRIAFVEFSDLRNAPQSVRECRFQTIGWILNTHEKLNSLVEDCGQITHEDNFVDALTRLASLDSMIASDLIRAENWRDKFNMIWPILSFQEHEQALLLNYDTYDYKNYWPGFDTFNVIFHKYFRKAPYIELKKVPTENLLD
ncbi:hypothetical protein EKG40_08270 [Pseudomonas moorei]|nr:hypothetical protein EKG40_08270 [Pseudomonas moorei]